MKQKLTKPHKHMVPAIHAWLSENTNRIHMHVIAGFDGLMLAGIKGKEVELSVMNHEDQKTITAKFEIVNLSVGYEATNKLTFDENEMRFQTRFNGKVQDVIVPYEAIKWMAPPDLDIGGPGFTSAFTVEDLKYAKEVQGQLQENSAAPFTEEKRLPKQVNHLKLVKLNEPDL